jgi:hypothetical protein
MVEILDRSVFRRPFGVEHGVAVIAGRKCHSSHIARSAGLLSGSPFGFEVSHVCLLLAKLKCGVSNYTLAVKFLSSLFGCHWSLPIPGIANM